MLSTHHPLCLPVDNAPVTLTGHVVSSKPPPLSLPSHEMGSETLPLVAGTDVSRAQHTSQGLGGCLVPEGRSLERGQRGFRHHLVPSPTTWSPSPPRVPDNPPAQQRRPTPGR